MTSRPFSRARSSLLALALAASLVTPLVRVTPAAAQLPPPGSATTWFFAEGNTLAGWYEFLVIINPFPSDVTVQVDYQLEEPAGVPQPPQSRSLLVPANERRTISVFEDALGVGRTFTGVSARLSASAPFVAERPMYFVNPFDIGVVNGTHDALGVNVPSQTWYFAEGSTLVDTTTGGQIDGGFQPFFTMQNVSGADAGVEITYFTNNPDSTVAKLITLPNNARVTTDIANPFANPAYPGSLGPGFEGFGTQIVASQPIIVERPFYVNRDFGAPLNQVNAATDERGATTADAQTRLFAEGTVLSGFSEFLTIFNPNPNDAQLAIDYFVEGLTTPVTKPLTVPATSRRTVQVFDPAGSGLGRDLPNTSAPGSAGVSVQIRSENGIGFVAERPIYFVHDFGNGVVNGAHDVLGATQAGSSWFFAEGTIRPGFFEFVTIQNPNPAPARARLDYLLEGQPPISAFRDLPPSSRVTVVLTDPNTPGGLGLPAPGDVDFGLRVTSVDPAGVPTNDLPIVAERPIYVNTSIAGSELAINGGHNTLGYEFAAEDLPPLQNVPNLELLKEALPFRLGLHGINSEITYTLTVRHAGTALPATGVTIVDVLPDDAVLIRAEGNPTVEGSTLSFNVGDVAPGEEVALNYVISYQVAETKTNSAIARSTNGAVATAQETIPVGAGANFRITKADSPDPVVVGQQLVYTVVATNDGPEHPKDAFLDDTLPDNVTFVSASFLKGDDTKPCSFANGVVHCELGFMPCGEIVTATIVVNVDETAVGTITNTATTGPLPDDLGTHPDPDPSNNTVSEPTRVLAATDLSIAKVASTEQATVSEELTYTLTVTNNGPNDATGVQVTDTLPANVTVVRQSPGCSAGGLCSIGALADGASRVLTFTVVPNVAAGDAGSILNSATVGGAEVDLDGSDNTASVTVPVRPKAALSITKTGPAGPVEELSEITYSITVNNAGPSSATGVIVTDTPQAGLSVRRVSPGCTPSGGSVFCSVPPIAAGAQAQITITVTSTVTGEVVNTATVGSSTFEADLLDNTATHTVLVTVRAPDLSITKTASPNVVTAGDELTYTLVVSNPGPTHSNTVSVTDTLPFGVDFITVTTSGGTCTEMTGTISCVTDTISIGSQLTITIVGRPGGETVGVVTNTATLGAFPENNPANNTASVTTTVQRATTDLQIAKDDSAEPVVAGSYLTYTVTVTNLGPDNADNFFFEDRLPSLAQVQLVSVASEGICGLSQPDVVRCDYLDTLFVGESVTATIVVRTLRSETITNRVDLTATAGSDPTLTNNRDTEPTNVLPGADLSIAKVGPSAPVGQGTPFTYTITVTNLGPDPGDSASGVVVTDTLDPSVTFLGASDECGPAVAGVVTCSLGTMPTGASAEVTISVTGNLTGTITNSAGVTFALPDDVQTPQSPDDPDFSNNYTTITSTIRPPLADLVVTKTDSPDPVGAGSPLTYTVTVVNNGPDEAVAVVLTDTPDPTVEIHTVTSDTANCNFGITQAVCSVPSLAPGQGSTVTLTVTSTATSGSVIENTATVTAATVDPNPFSNIDIEQTTVQVPRADLLLTKTDTPDPALQNAEITYNITVTNLGPDEALTVTVTDFLPVTATFLRVSPTPQCAPSGQQVECFYGTVDVGQSVTAEIVVRAGAPETIRNRAVVTTSSVDNNSGNNEDTEPTQVLPSADLAVFKTAPPTITPGSTITYEITATNLAGVAAQNVSLSDTLPGSPTSLANSANASCQIVANVLTCTTAALNAGQSITAVVTIDITGHPDCVINNAATGTFAAPDDPNHPSSPDDPNFANNRAEVSTSISPCANLSVRKSAEPDPAIRGSVLTYTVVVSNEGQDTAEDVVLTDTIEGGGFAEDFDDLTPPALPAGWTTSDTGAGVPWVTTDTIADTPPNSAYITDTADDSVHSLISPSFSFQTGTELTFEHSYHLEALGGGQACDSAVLEISIDGGPFVDIQVAGTFVTGGYDSEVVCVNNPHLGRDAWSGDSAGFTTTIVSLSATGQTARLAWTVATDQSNSADPDAVGWFVDSIRITDGGSDTRVFALGDIAPGDSITTVITVTVPAGTEGPITNTATALSPTFDPNLSDNTATITTMVVGGADLRVTKTASSLTTTVNGDVTYTVVVTNDGPDPSGPVTLTDTVEGPGTITAADESEFGPPPCDFIPPGQLVCFAPDIAPGSSRTLTITVTANDVGTITNTAVATGASADPNLTNNTAMVTTTVVPSADLVASVELLSVSASEFYITTTVTNVGPDSVATTDVTFTITQDQGVVGMDPLVPSGTATGSSCSGLVGNPFTPGTWGGSCTDVVMAPGQFIRTVFHVFYATPPTLTARSEGFDRVVVDPDTSNNIDTESTGP